MKKLNRVWIQYSHADPVDAAVLQTAGSEREAKQDDEIFPGNPWYCYDVQKASDGELLTNPVGPIYLNPHAQF